MNMTAVVSVLRDGLPLTLAEVTKVRDTPAMARRLREIWPADKHPITIYPDASGANTSSKNASESDLSILRSTETTAVMFITLKSMPTCSASPSRMRSLV